MKIRKTNPRWSDARIYAGEIAFDQGVRSDVYRNVEVGWGQWDVVFTSDVSMVSGRTAVVVSPEGYFEGGNDRPV